MKNSIELNTNIQNIASAYGGVRGTTLSSRHNMRHWQTRRLNSLYGYLADNNIIQVPNRETFAQRKRDLIDFNQLQLA